MIICPSCDYENLPGADVCDQCGSSLDELTLPVPATKLERSLMRDRIRSLMSTPPLGVPPGTPVLEVLRLMDQHQVGCLMIVEHGRLVGVFTERDALLKLGPEATALGARPVSEFMTRQLQTLQPDAKVAFALQRMDLGGFRHIPVVSAQGDPLGLISVRDILDYLTEKL